MTYCTWDIETTIKRSYKRKANPFDPENKVVMQGYKRQGGQVHGEYYGRNAPDANWFIQLLNGTSLLVGFNIKFDLLYALREPHNLAAWMSWVAKGGNVWDCQLAEYLLNGMTRDSHMLSLDEVAPVYGGNIKFDEVKALWEAGVDTVDIDRNLLTRYLCGTDTDHGDIGNTELVFLGQLARARKTGQVKSILLNMGSLLATIEMERNGMKVDVERGLVLAQELEEKISVLKAELNAYLPELPFTFKWTSRTQVSALIFGGTVKYEKRVPIFDDHGNQAYAQMDQRQWVLTDGSTTPEEPWNEMGVVLESRYVRYAGGKNKGEYKTKLVKVNDPSKPKSRMEDFLFTFPRMTEPKAEWEGATPGVYSVAADIITELGNRDIPFLKKFAELTGAVKDLGTYYITADPETGEKKGMLTLVQPDGIIHHSLNHTSTVTARFSSSNPNLQNIPKEGKSVVKTVFVSRYPGGSIIQSDFTALEVYVQAILTKCGQLITDLRSGLDMHCVRVSQKEGIPYEEAVLRCKGSDTQEADPVWKKKRTKAKEFSFQRAYGAGATKIAESTGMDISEVEALIEAEQSRYPEVEPFYVAVTAQIERNRVPTSRFVPHPTIRGAMCQLGKSSYRTPDNKLYCYDEQPTPDFVAKRGKLQGFSPTEIKNYIVQGTGGEWAKAAMWLAVREFYRLGNFDGTACLVNQVHDAVYADAAPSSVVSAGSTLHACMLAASEFIEWWFGWPVPVAVPSETMAGDNMMEEHRFDLTQAENYRKQIRQLYMPGLSTPTFEKE